MEYKLTLTMSAPAESIKLIEELEAAIPVQVTEQAMRTWTQRGGTLDDNAGFTEVRIKYDAPAEISQAEKDALQTALDAHDGIGELDRLPKKKAALKWKKDQLATIDWSNVSLTAGERKLILVLPLTRSEEDAIITEWEA